MFGWIVVVVAAVAVGLVVVAVVFVVGMRAKSPLVFGPIVWFSRHVLNPMQMRTAGRPGAYASIIRHRGRISGRPYATPVGPVATEDGFLIALPYGTRTNWLRNVVASGGATLETEGETYEVDQPEVIPMASVLDRFSAGDQRSSRLLAVDACLRLRRVDRVRSETRAITQPEPAAPVAGATR